jgi:enoyl-CoA hydratase/carnithine racemase
VREERVPDIEYEVQNRVAWIRLNRPTLKNSFTLEMIDAWKGFLEQAQRDDGVGAIVVTGTGGSFCAGADLSIIEELNAKGSAQAWKSLLWDRVHRIAFTLENVDKPVTAAMGGVAVGAGLDMALMCDMRFASRSATFSEGYIRLGAVPGDGGCWFLPRLVGVAKALELLLSGEFIDADEALRIGMVNRVYEDSELQQKTQEFAEKLAAHSPVAMRAIKRTTCQGLRMDMRSSLDMISSHMGMVQTTADAAEAMNAFRERRAPRFKGS